MSVDLRGLGGGLHFLRGVNRMQPRLASNGAGKTSIISALVWGLYGRTPNLLRGSAVRSWQRRKDATTTCVRVGFMIDGVEHTLTRKLGANGLLVDDSVCGQDDVDALLRIPFELFVHTVVFGQGRPLFLDLEPRRKLELLSTVLGLDRWEERSKAAGARADELDRGLAVMQGEAGRIATEIEVLDGRAGSLRARSAEWAAGSREHAQTVESELAEAVRLEQKLKNRVDELGLRLDGALTELRPLRGELEKLDERLRAVERNRADFQARIDLAERRVVQLRADVAAMRGRQCPVCGQRVRAGMLDAHQQEVVRELRACERTIADGIPTKTRELLRDLPRQREVLARAADDYQRRADKAQDALGGAGTLLADARVAATRLRADQERLSTDVNPYQAQLSELRARRATLRDDAKDVEARIAKRQRRIERTRFWVRGFKEVRLSIIGEILQELEFATSAALVDIGLDGWEIRYAAERETKAGTSRRELSVTVLSPDNAAPVPWEAWSGGEAQRLRIVGSVALADVLLARLGVSCGLEILDEPSRHMANIRELVDYLADRARAARKQIVLVDHRTVESHRYASVITVVKEKGGSRLEAL